MSAEPPDDAGTSAEPPSSDWGDADPFGSDATMPLQPDPLLGIAGPFNGRIFAFGGFGLMLKSEDQGQNWTRVTDATLRSEEHTSELQSIMRISYTVVCLKNKLTRNIHSHTNNYN